MAKKISNRLFIPKTGPSSGIKVRFIGPNQEMYLCFNKTDLKNTLFREVVSDELAKTYHTSKRVISFVIDRNDSDRIKIFDCPITAWKQVLESDDVHRDFYITRTGHGLSTRYTVMEGDRSDITKEKEITVFSTLNSFSFRHILVRKEDWHFMMEIPEPINSRFDILDL